MFLGGYLADGNNAYGSVAVEVGGWHLKYDNLTYFRRL